MAGDMVIGITFVLGSEFSTQSLRFGENRLLFLQYFRDFLQSSASEKCIFRTLATDWFFHAPHQSITPGASRENL